MPNCSTFKCRIRFFSWLGPQKVQLFKQLGWIRHLETDARLSWQTGSKKLILLASHGNPHGTDLSRRSKRLGRLTFVQKPKVRRSLNIELSQSGVGHVPSQPFYTEPDRAMPLGKWSSRPRGPFRKLVFPEPPSVRFPWGGRVPFADLSVETDATGFCRARGSACRRKSCCASARRRLVGAS